MYVPLCTSYSSLLYLYSISFFFFRFWLLTLCNFLTLLSPFFSFENGTLQSDKNGMLVFSFYYPLSLWSPDVLLFFLLCVYPSFSSILQEPSTTASPTFNHPRVDSPVFQSDSSHHHSSPPPPYSSVPVRYSALFLSLYMCSCIWAFILYSLFSPH